MSIEKTPCKPMVAIGDGDRITMDKTSKEVKIENVVKFVYFSYFTKRLLRSLWTFLITGKRIRDLVELSEDEGYCYFLWLANQMLHRQHHRPINWCGNYTFWYIIQDEMVNYEKIRQNHYINSYSKGRCSFNPVQSVRKLTFEEKYNIEKEDKVKALEKWLNHPMRWATVERFMEGPNVIEDEMTVEEEMEFEEELVEEQRLIEERQEAEQRRIDAMEAFQNKETSLSLSSGEFDNEDDMPSSFLRRWVQFVTFWVSERRSGKYDDSEISCFSSPVSSIDVESTIADDEMSEESDPMRVKKGPVKTKKGYRRQIRVMQGPSQIMEGPVIGLRVNMEIPRGDVEGSVESSKGYMEESVESSRRVVEESLENPRGDMEESLGSPRGDVEGSMESPRRDMEESLESPREDMEGSLESPRGDMEGSLESPRGDMEGSLESLRRDLEESLGSPREHFEGSMGSPERDMEGSLESLREELEDIIKSAMKQLSEPEEEEEEEEYEEEEEDYEEEEYYDEEEGDLEEEYEVEDEEDEDDKDGEEYHMQHKRRWIG